LLLRIFFTGFEPARGGEGVGKGGVKGLSLRARVREKVRGEYRFSSLVKLKFASSFTSGFFFKKKFCYEVFAKQKKTERFFHSFSFGKKFNVLYPWQNRRFYKVPDFRHLYLYNTLENIFLKRGVSTF
jgi:hypothetical protein